VSPFNYSRQLYNFSFIMHTESQPQVTHTEAITSTYQYQAPLAEKELDYNHELNRMGKELDALKAEGGKVGVLFGLGQTGRANASLFIAILCLVAATICYSVDKTQTVFPLSLVGVATTAMGYTFGVKTSDKKS
jgi:hypothetical protein